MLVRWWCVSECVQMCKCESSLPPPPSLSLSLTLFSHAHKAAVTCVKWNRNGTWLLTGSRDHLIKLYDIRTMKELEVLKGHKSDVNSKWMILPFRILSPVQCNPFFRTH